MDGEGMTGLIAAARDLININENRLLGANMAAPELTLRR
jgi:hypothetical protein